jgi:hypothetical protein
VLPGAEEVAKNDNGDLSMLVWESAIIYRDNTFWTTLNHHMPLPSFEDRFASIPWRESLVKYEPAELTSTTLRGLRAQLRRCY